MIPTGSRQGLPGTVVALLAVLSPAVAAAQTLSREAEIVFQIPGQAALRPNTGTVEVLENGQPRKVLAVEPVTDPWRVLVYFDMAASTPEGVEAAASAIGDAAEAMVALGRVEIVTADRFPETVLSPTRDAAAVRQAAADVAQRAGEAGGLLGLRIDADSIRVAADSALASRQIADLFEGFQLELDSLAWQRTSLLEAVRSENWATGPPRMLLLVQDGMDLDLASFARRLLGGPATTIDARARAEQRQQRNLTRTLAALGWRVYPLFAAPPDERIDGLLPGRRAQQDRFAQASAGKVVTDRDELIGAIGQLTPSWRLRYESTGMRDGMPHPVNLRVTASGVPGPPGEVAGRRWASVALPSDLVALRAGKALDLVASDSEEAVPPGNSELTVRAALLPLGIEAVDRGTAAELVAVDGLVTFAGTAPGTSESLRVTIHGRALDAPPFLLHRLGDGAALDGNVWRFRTLINLPIAIDELVLTVEDLRTDRWQVAFLETASQPIDDRSDRELLTSDGSASGRGTELTEARIIAAARAGERVFGRRSDPTAPGAGRGTESGQTVIRLIPPRGLRSGLSGRKTFDIVAISDAVRRVEFYLDQELVSDDKRRPFSATIDLGSEAAEHVIQAIAYSRSGIPLGRDELPINRTRAETRIAFRTVAPGPNGSFDVEAAVELKEDEGLDRIEFYRNERLAATLNRPPWRTRLPGPVQPGADFARLAVYLEDGSVVEDVRFLSSDDFVAETVVNLVEVYVVINDDEGQPITTLERDDFVLRAGRREIPIERFAVAEDVPLVLGLAIDSSESMLPIMPDVQRAAARFLGNVLTEIDQAFVVEFDSRPRLVEETTDDVVKLIGSLNRLQAGGMTALYDAMQFGLAELARDQGRRALVILTDGDDFGSQSGYRKTFRTAGNTGVPIYVLSMANESLLQRGLRKHDLEAISKESGGRVYYVRNMESLLWAYGHISRELQSQYLLGYTTETPLTQKEVQSLKVELRSGKAPKQEIRVIVGRGRG